VDEIIDKVIDFKSKSIEYKRIVDEKEV